MFLYLFFACSSTNERGNLSVASKKSGAILDVTVQPHDAAISINGLPWRGETLSKGIHQLKIEKKGFHSEQRILSIDDLDLLKLDITLRSNDVPLHFYYPTEESFILHHQDTRQEFQGSAILDVPVGFVEIKTESGMRVFSGIVHEEQHIHRCPKEESQKTDCVSSLNLPSSPLDMAFCQNKLWISTFPENRGLYLYDLEVGSLSQQMELDSSTWMHCDGENLLLLSEKGVLSKYQIQSKKRTDIHTFAHSWLNGFLSSNNMVTSFNWYHNKVVQWDGVTERVLHISKPKGLYHYQDEVYILGSEPGSMYDASGKLIWRVLNTQLVKGVMLSSNNNFWGLDGANNEIISVSMIDGKKTVFESGDKGEKKDFIVTDSLVIVAEHYPQSGFSLGKGEIKVYHRLSKKLMDVFPTVNAPSKLYLGPDNILVVTDISSRKIQVFDLSPLLKN